MAAPTVKGTSLIVGIGAYTYSGNIVEDVSTSPKADVEEIRDEDNNVVTKLISNPGKEISVSIIAKTGSGVDALKIGDAISINSVAYMVTDVQVKRSRTALKATIKAIKEDSMTYS